MAIRDMSHWPDDKIPAWVLRHRVAMREAPEKERKRLEMLDRVYGRTKKDDTQD